MEGELKNKKIKLIGARHGISGSDWRERISDKLETCGSEILESYVKPYVYTPREYPDTHEHLKAMKDTGYFQVFSSVKRLSLLDRDWIATHMKDVRSHELDNIKDCDLVIGYIDPDIFTLGAFEELCYACLFRKPIFLVVAGGIIGSPLWLIGMFRYEYIFSSFNQLTDAIDNINNGKISINPDDYWDIRDYDADYYDAIYKATNQKE